MKLGSLRVSNRVPDVAASGQKMLVTLNAPMVPLRVPTWMGVEIIVDPYTQAGKGIKVCTATMLVGDAARAVRDQPAQGSPPEAELMEHLTAPVECRASESGPALHATILTEGAAASGGRAEVFRVGSATWPHDGVAVRLEHHGAAVARAVPTRDQATGEIRISVPANDVLRTAVDRGREAPCKYRVPRA